MYAPRIALALAIAVLPCTALLAQERGERKGEAETEHALAAARVPAAVRNAVHTAFPNARVTKWTSEVEDGKTMYEAETVEGAIHRDLLLNADGSVAETETQVALEQLPAAVRTVATANGRHVERAELVVAGRDTTYEFKIAGRRDELKLLPNGHAKPAERH